MMRAMMFCLCRIRRTRRILKSTSKHRRPFRDVVIGMADGLTVAVRPRPRGLSGHGVADGDCGDRGDG